MKKNEYRILTSADCMRAINEHGLDLVLWDRFWSYMEKKSRLGASYEYVEQSYKILETIWLLEIGEK